MASMYPHANYLTNEEVDYELIIRGKTEELKCDLESKYRLLRNLFHEDIAENRTYASPYSFDQEFDYVVNKFDSLSKKLEKGYDESCVSRVKHYLMRLQRVKLTDSVSEIACKDMIREMRELINQFKKKQTKTGSEKTDVDSKEVQQENEEREDGAVGGLPTETKGQGEELTDTPKGTIQQNKNTGTIRKDQTQKGKAGQNKATNDEEVASILAQIRKLEDRLAACNTDVQREVSWRWKKPDHQEPESTGNVKWRNPDKNTGIPQDEGLGYAVDYFKKRQQMMEDRFFGSSNEQDEEFCPWSKSGSNRNSAKHRGRWNQGVDEEFDPRYDEGLDGQRQQRNNFRGRPQQSRSTEFTTASSRDWNRQRRQGNQTNQNEFEISSDEEADYENQIQQRNNHRRQFQQNEPAGRRNVRNNQWQQEYREITEFEIRNADRRMDKWHITFDGESRNTKPLEDFLHKVRRLATMDRIREDVLLSRIHTLLRGAPKDWYLIYANEFLDWDDFEKKFRYMYGNPNKDQGNRKKIYDRYQQRSESFLTFKMEIERLNKLLTVPLSEERLFEIIWDRMRPHYKSRLACRRVEDLRKLEYYAYKIDANDPAFNQSRDTQTTRVTASTHTVGRNAGAVRNIEVEEDSMEDYSACSETEEVNVIGKKGDREKDRKSSSTVKTAVAKSQESANKQSGPLCWNCDKTGHIWRECTVDRKRFCFICGNPGKTTATCEKHRRVASSESNANTEN